MEWEEDSKLQEKMEEVIGLLGMDHIKADRVFCYRTTGSKTRAYARIWAFPKIFQKVLGQRPAYVIEVVSQNYDKLNDEQKTKVVIHELLHIPSNFSGSLLPHKYGNKKIDKEVDKLYKNLKKEPSFLNKLK